MHTCETCHWQNSGLCHLKPPVITNTQKIEVGIKLGEQPTVYNSSYSQTEYPTVQYHHFCAFHSDLKRGLLDDEVERLIAS